MKAATLMVMGTHSNAGKSMLVTALCRMFARQGHRVAPFKAQNMALNAGVTPEGHEIGRSTIAQAEAAGVEPHVDMNPILLKPHGDRSQLILNGRPDGYVHLGNWRRRKPQLWRQIRAALDRLRARSELVIIEGAGSPAEVNLKADDIVNMRVAREVGAPVLLVGDIDRGGVFAALLGTVMLLEPEERDLVKGFVINKFRGDPSLLGDGLRVLEERAFHTPTLGVIPFLRDIGLPEEDSVSLDAPRSAESPGGGTGSVDIAVIRLPHLSNFDDFDPVAHEPGVRLRFVERRGELGTPTAIILPGTKATLADLTWLEESGLAERIGALARSGTAVVGICGGYQMMGLEVADPEGVEAEPQARVRCLALLPIRTAFVGEKRTVRVQAAPEADRGPFAALRGTSLQAYEIHMGRSFPVDEAGASPLFRIRDPSGDHSDGALDATGCIWGTYLHGLFDNDALRHTWLQSLGWKEEGQHFDRQLAYDRLADHVESHLDMAAVEGLIRWPQRPSLPKGVSADENPDDG